MLNMQNQFDNFYDYFYVNSNGQRRKNAIFAPGVDRFILIDDKDFWMTLQTAEILSSKLPTVVYILPPSAQDIDNYNCINYTIYNKTQQKVGPSPIIAARQHPVLKFLYDDDELVDNGVPEDYKDNTGILTRLTEYAQFVQQQVYVFNITEAFYNIVNTNRFANLYIDNAWLENISSKVDRTKFEKGAFFELRKILHLADSIAEAERKIIEFWKHNSTDQVYLMNGYYKVLNQPIPSELVALSKTGPTNISTFLF